MSQTQAFLFSNPSATHNLGLDRPKGNILSILRRTAKLQRLQYRHLLEILSHFSLPHRNLFLNGWLNFRVKINAISTVIASAFEKTQKSLIT